MAINRDLAAAAGKLNGDDFLRADLNTTEL
jgi:hypothetical protein